MADLQTEFSISGQNTGVHDRLGANVYDAWQYFLEPNNHASRFPDNRDRVTPTKQTRTRELQSLITENLETFTLPDIKS